MILLRDCKNGPNKAREASHSFVESVYSETLHYSRLPHSVLGDAIISDGHSNLSYETVRNVSEYYPRRTEALIIIRIVSSAILSIERIVFVTNDIFCSRIRTDSKCMGAHRHRLPVPAFALRLRAHARGDARAICPV